ncbi:MAG: ABC transporter ATP-binding protein [Deltaproteobacteria bacterium]
MAEPGGDVLRLEGITRDFGEGEARTQVLRGVDLSLRRGEFAALMGPSGSGKSTLLHIMGLLDKPTGGRILLDGQDTGLLDDDGLTRYRGSTLGFVFQFHHLLPEFTALENVMIPMAAGKGRVEAPMRDAARALLDRVGLSARADNRATTLSGGQAQRVAIARSLARSPKVVLADEPTGNLDTQSADGVFALLRQVNREEQVTFLVVTHDRRLAERTDRIIELVDGRLVSDQPNQPR